MLRPFLNFSWSRIVCLFYVYLSEVSIMEKNDSRDTVPFKRAHLQAFMATIRNVCPRKSGHTYVFTACKQAIQAQTLPGSILPSCNTVKKTLLILSNFRVFCFCYKVPLKFNIVLYMVKNLQYFFCALHVMQSFICGDENIKYSILYSVP
jgi:hypothetical protein